MPAYLPQLAFQPYVQPDTGGEPIKELSDLGTSLNSAYNTSIAQQDALDEHMAQLQATLSPIDHPLLDSIEAGTRGDLEDIKKNGNYENAQMPLRAAARRLLTNPALIVAQQNAATRQKLEDLKVQAQAAGHHIIQYQDYNNTPSVDANGNLQKLSLDGVFDKKLDYLPKMQSIFEGLQANSIAEKDSRPERDEASGAIYQVGSGSSKRWVNSKMIQNVVANNLGNYLGTDEGQQQLKVLTTKNSENSTPLSTEEAKNKIANDLIMVGYTHRFNDSSSENSEKLAPGKQQPTGDGTTLTGDVAIQQNQDLSGTIDALTKKKQLTYSQGFDKMPVNTELGSLQRQGVKVGPGHSTVEPTYGEIPDNFKDTYNSMFKMYSDALGTTDPDIINPKIQSYLKGIQNSKITPTVHAFTETKQIDAANNFVRNGNLDGVPFYDPLTNKQMSLADIKANYKNDKGKPIDEEDIQKARVTGNYDADHPFAELTGNDAFVAPQKVILGGHNFVIGSQPQVNRSPAYIGNYLENKITKASRTGLPSKFVNPDTKDEVNVFAKGDGSYILQGKTRDGREIPPTPIPLDRLKDALYLSGYTTAK